MTRNITCDFIGINNCAKAHPYNTPVVCILCNDGYILLNGNCNSSIPS